MNGIVITPSGEISIRSFTTPLYKTIGDVVGGYIEHVNPMRLPAPYCMIVNEDGRALGLPVNPFGSFLYQTDVHGIPILGTVVIMQEGIIDGEQDFVGIPDADAKDLMESYIRKFNLIPKEET